MKVRVRELEARSYIPITGYAKVKEVESPIFHDGWAGAMVAMRLRLLRPVSAVSLYAYVPDWQVELSEIVLTIDGREFRRSVQPGMMEVRAKHAQPLSGELSIGISARGAMRPPRSDDERELAYLFDRLELLASLTWAEAPPDRAVIRELV